MSFKRNTQTGNFEVAADGVYENKNTGDRFQFRKGSVVGEDAANAMTRVGPWPGEVDEQAEEASATAKANPAPENKAAPAPATKQ